MITVMDIPRKQSAVRYGTKRGIHNTYRAALTSGLVRYRAIGTPELVKRMGSRWPKRSQPSPVRSSLNFLEYGRSPSSSFGSQGRLDNSRSGCLFTYFSLSGLLTLPFSVSSLLQDSSGTGTHTSTSILRARTSGQVGRLRARRVATQLTRLAVRHVA